MEQRPLGRSGLTVSVLSLGTMNFGADWHGVGAIDDKTADRLLGLSLDAGVNLIDTADIYGRGAAESMLGRLLKGRRAKVLLATKVLGQMGLKDPSSGGLSRKHILKGLDESLRRLKTDHVDLYMPHGWDQQVPLPESLEAFEDARASGKVRVLGCSNFDGMQLQEALAYQSTRRWARFEFDQVQYSAAARFIERDLVPVCRASDVGVLAWSPLGGGLLSGKYSDPTARGRWAKPAEAFPPLPQARVASLVRVLREVARLERLTPAQAALGWALARPWLTTAIVGARTPAQLAETLAARPLPPRALAFVDKGSDLCSVR